MANKPKAKAEIKSFPGLATTIDPDDMPPGQAEIQVNVGIGDLGSLEARRGYRAVSFDNE